jgi:hypothetical protein
MRDRYIGSGGRAVRRSLQHLGVVAVPSRLMPAVAPGSVSRKWQEAHRCEFPLPLTLFTPGHMSGADHLRKSRLTILRVKP